MIGFMDSLHSSSSSSSAASLLWHGQDLVKNAPFTLFFSIQMWWNFCVLGKGMENFRVETFLSNEKLPVGSHQR